MGRGKGGMERETALYNNLSPFLPSCIPVLLSSSLPPSSPPTLSPPPSLPSHLSLPEVDDVILLAVHQVGVEDDVGVSTKELAVHLGVHWGQLKVLDPPDLQSARAIVYQVLGLAGALLVHLVHVKLWLNWRGRRKEEGGRRGGRRKGGGKVRGREKSMQLVTF